MSETVRISSLKLQVNTDRSVVAEWKWDKQNTDHYEVKWKYLRINETTKEEVWYDADGGNIISTDRMQNIYTADGLDAAVKVLVRAVAKNKSANGDSDPHWPTTEWATSDPYSFDKNPPKKLSAPTVTIDKYQLTAEYKGLDDFNATGVEFEVIKNGDTSKPYKTQKYNIITNYATYTWTVEADSTYQVRARGYKGSVYGSWSDYSDQVYTAPTAPIITNINIRSETQIDITWKKTESADKYRFQYAKQVENLSIEEHFTDPGVEKKDFEVKIDELTVVEGEATLTISNLEKGHVYYIRMSASSSKSSSSSDNKVDWSKIESFVIGTEPTSPTTWSSTTTPVVGDKLEFNWIHNSADGSKMTSSQLNLYINGVLTNESPYIITKEAFNDTAGIISAKKFDDKKETVRICSVNTNYFSEGTTLEWEVRTAGVLQDKFSEYSTLRKVDIYDPPVISVNIYDTDGKVVNTLTSLPFKMEASVGNAVNQKPIGYYVNITANQSYESVDNVGNDIIITKGTNVYSKYFDVDNTADSDEFKILENGISVNLSANNISLSNGISYTVTCTVAMNSGLTASDSREFTVSWISDMISPFADITVNKDDISAYIMPYCNNNDDILLSVYRREFDGSFIEIATDIQDGSNTYVTDPHPSLDYARYRIVAKSKTTGTVTYTDMPSYRVGEKAVIIQWDETWRSFEALSEDRMSEQPRNGSILKLPYNIDTSDNYSPDVSLVEYIGRKRPVSYYGTQIRESSTWSVDVPKNDKETLYALRRLATWMGDVYVREPSGSGYWAQVTVSFSQTHCEVVIPVSFDIKRVEGGI